MYQASISMKIRRLIKWMLLIYALIKRSFYLRFLALLHLAVQKWVNNSEYMNTFIERNSSSRISILLRCHAPIFRSFIDFILNEYGNIYWGSWNWLDFFSLFITSTFHFFLVRVQCLIYNSFSICDLIDPFAWLRWKGWLNEIRWNRWNYLCVRERSIRHVSMGKRA